QQVFGANATQTSTTVTITKADFAATGFTSATTNTADSILAAIIAFAETNLPDTTASTDPTQTIGIADGYQSITTISNTQYLISPKNINFYKTFTDGTFNPNNY
ncbi:MAG: hypothetical protein ACYT04_59410, partial [Nostoc sp.]